MKRVIWLSDIHVDFLRPQEFAEFLQHVEAAQSDAILLSGDISDSPQLIAALERLGTGLSTPLYFVLGNHDYYFSSIARVRESVRELCRRMPRLVWLSEAGVIELAPQVGLVGHDGWADARLGDYMRSLIMMNDYRLIEELAGVEKRERWPLLKALGDEAANYVRRTLPGALDRYPRVILLTHVPPFRESCWYQGQISNDEWLPHFSCQAMGDAIIEVMHSYPGRELTVLCGHTHGRGEYRPTKNTVVLTAGAEYGQPEIQQVFEFE
jgi:Icc protein